MYDGGLLGVTGRAYWAGAIAGLLLFKPQLAAVLIAAACLSLGWQALLGVATTAFGLLTITMLSLPGALHDYLVKLPLALPLGLAGGTYLWERQITWLGFFRFLFQYHATGPAARWPSACSGRSGHWRSAACWQSLRSGHDTRAWPAAIA